jgi:hypothetical protein
MNGVASRLVTFALGMILATFGILILFLPVRFSKLLHWLLEPQWDILRGGSLFDMYWPERVERSRSLRTQIRLLGGLFLAFGVMVAVSK